LRSLKKKFADSRRTKIRTGKSGDRRQETEGKKQDSVVKKQETVPMKKFSPPQTKEVSLPTPHTPHPTPSLKAEVKKQENKVKKKPESENAPSLSLFTPQEPPENAILLLDAEDKISWTTPEQRAPERKKSRIAFTESTGANKAASHR